MKYILNNNLKHNGKRYKAGSVFEAADLKKAGIDPKKINCSRYEPPEPIKPTKLGD